MTLPEIFFNPKQAREMANHNSEKKTEDKKERGKKIQKSKSLKLWSLSRLKTLKILISAHAWAKMS